MANERQQMIDKLEEWLSKKGYPTEMAVAQALVRQHFDVITSDYYADPNEAKMREIDVVATRAIAVDQDAFRLSWVIECKTAKKGPWVLLSPTELVIEPEEQLSARPTSALARDVLRHMDKATGRNNAHEIFMPLEPLGASLVPAFTDADSAFTALCSCVKASDYRIKRANESLSSFMSSWLIGEIAFPTIVIEGKLFHAWFSEKAKLQVAEIDSGTVVWRNEEFGIPRILVSVYTLSHFRNMVAGLAKCADQFFDEGSQVINSAVRSWRARSLQQVNV